MKSFRKLLTFKKKTDENSAGARSSSKGRSLSFHDNPMGIRGGEGSLDKRSLSRQASAERLRQRPAPVPEALFIEPPSIEVARLVKKAPPDSLGGRVWSASVNWSADGTAGPPQKKKSRLFGSSASSAPSPPRPSPSRPSSKESVLGFRFAMNRTKKTAAPSAAAGADAGKEGKEAGVTAASAAAASESVRPQQGSDLPPLPPPPRVVQANGHRGGRGSRGRLNSHGSGSSVDDDDDDSDDDLSDEEEFDVGDPNVLPPAEDMEPDGPPQLATCDGSEDGGGDGWEEYDENCDTLEAEEDFQRQRAGSRSRTKSVYKSDSEGDEDDPDAPEPYLVNGAGEGGENGGNGNPFRGRTLSSGSSAGRGGGRSSTGRPGYGTAHGVVSANMQRIDMMKAAGYGNRPERSSFDRVTPGEKAALEAGLETRIGELSPSRGQQRTPVLAFGSPARERAGSFGPGLGDGQDGASKDVDDDNDEDDEESSNVRRSPFGFFRRPTGRRSFTSSSYAKTRGTKSRRGSGHRASAMAAELVQALAPGPSVVASLQRARIVVVGDEGVGVSALVRRFTLQPPTTDVDLVTGYGAWDPEEFLDTAAQTKTEARREKDRKARKEARKLAKQQQQHHEQTTSVAESADATATTSAMAVRNSGSSSPRAMSTSGSNGLRSSRGRSLSTDVGPSLSIRRSAESARSLSPVPSSTYADDIIAKERAIAAERASKSGPWHAIRPITLHGSNSAVYPYQVQVYDLGRVLHPRFKPADSSTNERTAPEDTGTKNNSKKAKSDLSSSNSVPEAEAGVVVASETTNRLVEDVVDAPEDDGIDNTGATGKVKVASGLGTTLMRPSLVGLEAMNVSDVAVSTEPDDDDDNDDEPLPQSSLLGVKKFKSDAHATTGDDDDDAKDDKNLVPFPPNVPRGSLSPSKMRVRLPTGGTGSSDSDDPMMAHGRLSSRIGNGAHAHRLLEDPPESVLQRASPMHRGSPPSSPPYFPVRTPSNDFPDLQRPSGETLLRKPTDDLTPVPETRSSGDASSSTSEGKLSEASTGDNSGIKKKSVPEPLTTENKLAGTRPSEAREEKGESDSDDDSNDDDDDEEAQGYDDPAMSVTRRAVCDAYLRSATGIVLVYDIGDADTLEGLDQWLTRLEAAGVDFQRVPVAIFCNKIDLAAPASLRPSPEFSLAGGGDPADEALRRGANGVDHSSGSGSESSVPRTRSQTPVESASESDTESGSDLQAMRALHRGTTSSSISPPRGSESYWFGGSNKAGTKIKGTAVDASASGGGGSHDKPPGERGVEVKGCAGKLRSRSSSIGLRDSNGGLRDSTGASGKGRDSSFRTSLGQRLSSWNPKLFTRNSFECRDDMSGGAYSSEPPQPKVSRKSIMVRQQEEALTRAVLESRDARAKLYKSIEDFPQVRLAREVAEQRGLGSDIRGVLGGLNNSNHGGTFDNGAVGAGGGNSSGGSSTFTVDLVSSATGEGVHAAFNRLMVAVQKRQHAQRPHRFALSSGAVTVTDHGPNHGDDRDGSMRRGSASSRSTRRASRRSKALTLSGGRANRANSGGISATSSSSPSSSPGGKLRPLQKLALWGTHSKERNGDSPRDEAPHDAGL